MSARPCTIEECPDFAVREVRYAMTERGWYCERHARWVESIEREWDRAEAEYLEQF